MEPMLYERSIGIGFQLPRNFELRATQHQVDYLGRYDRLLGSADLGTNGPMASMQRSECAGPSGATATKARRLTEEPH